MGLAWVMLLLSECIFAPWRANQLRKQRHRVATSPLAPHSRIQTAIYRRSWTLILVGSGTRVLTPIRYVARLITTQLWVRHLMPGRTWKRATKPIQPIRRAMHPQQAIHFLRQAWGMFGNLRTPSPPAPAQRSPLNFRLANTRKMRIGFFGRAIGTVKTVHLLVSHLRCGSAERTLTCSLLQRCRRRQRAYVAFHGLQIQLTLLGT
jgi:hypothetical protein